MIDVTIANFEQEVIEASMHTPVLVDFWAPWCGPCKTLGPLLEKVEAAYAGRFRLVKIDSDQEQQLGAAFGIRSIPTCVLMMGGKPVDGFTGALPESKVKEFLDKHLPPALDEPEPEPDTDPAMASPEEELKRLKHASHEKSSDDNLRFEYLRALMTQGHVEEAKTVFAPAAGRAAGSRRLQAVQLWLDALEASSAIKDPAGAKSGFDARIAANKRDFDARYALAQWFMAQQRWKEAMDELLEILMRDKAWNDDLARKTIIAILEIIEMPKPKVADGQIPPDDPLVATYRRRLSSVVLS
ncbi:MAG: thioredoxin [Pseudomonadota bacterium]